MSPTHAISRSVALRASAAFMVVSTIEIVLTQPRDASALAVLIVAGIGAGCVIASRSIAAGTLVACSCAVISDLIAASAGEPPPTLVSGLALVAFAYAAAAHGRPVDWLVVGLCLLATITVGLRSERLRGGGLDASEIFASIMLFAVAGAAGVAQRSRRSVQAAREREHIASQRLRLARELHDTVAHYTSAMLIQTQVAAAKNDSGDTVAVAAALAQVAEQGRESLRRTQDLVGRWRAEDPAASRPDAAANALAALAGPADPTHAIAGVHVEGAHRLATAPPAVAAACFSIAREAVTNARRHAVGATRIHVECGADGNGITLTVRDNGSPNRSGPSGEGWGLRGIRETAAEAGGEASWSQTPTGWLVRADFSFRGEEVRA